MKNGRPQAKDIPDARALEAVLKCMDHPLTGLAFLPYSTKEVMQGYWHGPANIWDVTKELGLPDKVVLAKMRALERRGLIGGPGCCTCGCRGDFELTKQGEGFLGEANAVAVQLEQIDAPSLYRNVDPALLASLKAALKLRP